MNINFLISTIDNRISNIKLNQNFHYTISHQITKDLNEQSCSWIKNLDSLVNVKYVICAEIGVSANRNHAILNRFKNCNYFIISDDDVEYDFDAIPQILSCLDKFEAITFQIKKPNGLLFKNYPKQSNWHNFFSIGPVGSIEIAFKEPFLKEMILFNECFGPGSKNQIGEDYIFMFDNVVRKKKKIRYCPVPFVQHDEYSTGSNFSDRKLNYGRGAMLRYCFGSFVYPIIIIWSIKKYPVYKKYISFRHILLDLFKGSKNLRC